MFFYSRGSIKKAYNFTKINDKNYVFFEKNQNEFNVTLSLFKDDYKKYPDIVKSIWIENIETKLGVFGFKPILKNLPKFPGKLIKRNTISFSLEF